MMMIKPYLKWVGNKQKLFSELYSHLPMTYENYYEPFVGSASVFLGIVSDENNIFPKVPKQQYYLSDINKHLINCHQVVATRYNKLCDKLAVFNEKDSPEFYNTERQKTSSFSQMGTNVTAAARFIYLNRRAYGGMWRENNDGFFNVPRCDTQTISLIDPKLLNRIRNCVKPLAKAIITCSEYQVIKPQKGDFVFLDPPYYPLSYSSNFTAYSKNGWSKTDHNTFFDFIDQLNDQGVKFLMTNNCSDYVLQRLSKYHVSEHQVHRFIDALNYGDDTTKVKRDLVNEIMVWNY